ncbi:MAG: type II secretion system F family protein [Lachnospiraceae bacterium]|nr:type II secretion system F family protein [Lachnospiraceae bacterium]
MTDWDWLYGDEKTLDQKDGLESQAEAGNEGRSTEDLWEMNGSESMTDSREADHPGRTKKTSNRYRLQELSAFCLQISLLLEAAVPLDEGLAIMAEDAGQSWEKEMLLSMAEGVELGIPFYQVLEDTGAFPPYVVRMAKLGHSTGTLDRMMLSLSEYYEKEFFLMRNIKNALTYPIIMVFMLLAVLFVLFVKVMPIFEDVYSQLGAEVPGAARSAIRFGGGFSGAALAVSAVLLVLCSGLWMASKLGGRLSLIEKLIQRGKKRSRIALAVSNRRFTSVLALTLQSGLELEKGLALAAELAENPAVEEKIGLCRKMLEDGQSYYEAMKATGLFSGFHIQMIRTGTRSGHLDRVMEDISRDYEQQADTAIDNIISRFEPTMVAVLAVAVGLVLLSVMLPLVGVLSAIG